MCSAAYLLSTPVETKKGRRPYTKLQQRCLDLQNTLPPITERQLEWGRNAIDPVGYYVRKGRNGRNSFMWCQLCGHTEEVGMSPLYVSVTDEKYTCPCCGKHLRIKHFPLDRKDVEYNDPFVVLTTCEDMQVARVFNIHRWNTVGRKPVEHVSEVFSVWFEPNKCKETIVTRPYTRGFNFFRWRMTEPFKIGRHNGSCTGYYQYDDVYDLYGYNIYPRMRILPILRRNGWSNRMAKMRTSPVRMWRTLLTDPAAEGLAKTGQFDVLDYWFKTGDENRDKSEWLPLVKICNRRKYIIRDASLWFDVVKTLRKLRMDTHSPKYICPADLHQMHDWLQRKLEAKKIKEELRKLNSQAKNWEEFYREKKGKYLPISFNDGNIYCHVIQSVAEMCEEGERMHHCVYRMGYYKKPDSLILSARNDKGQRLETVEVNLKNYTVVQSRGLQNQRTPAHSEIIKLVENNMHKIRKV